MPRSKTGSGVPAGSTLKHPAHIDEFLLYRLHNLARVATRGVGLMFSREIGISRRDWRILAFVGREPKISLSRLAELAGLDVVVTSRCVSLLVKRGLIANVRLPENKRVVVLTLTDAGEAVYERALASAQRYNIEFLQCLTDEEATVLDHLLTRLEARSEELKAREAGKSAEDVSDGRDE